MDRYPLPRKLKAYHRNEVEDPHQRGGETPEEYSWTKQKGGESSAEAAVAVAVAVVVP